MALTLSRASAPRSTLARPRSRPAVVAVKALSLREGLNQIADAFVRVLSPPQDTVKTFPTNNFSGKITHHERPRRPFRDGYAGSTSARSSKVSSAKVPIRTPESSLQVTDTASAVGYVEGAVKGVVAGLTSKAPSAPTWTGQRGWKGEVHSSNKKNPRDGFHAKRY